jgi:hypothetical protein
VVVEVRVELGSVRLDSGRVPEHILVTPLVDEVVDLPSELGKDVDSEVLVLEPNTDQAVVGPTVVDPAGHQ